MPLCFTKCLAKYATLLDTTIQAFTSSHGVYVKLSATFGLIIHRLLSLLDGPNLPSKFLFLLLCQSLQLCVLIVQLLTPNKTSPVFLP